MFILKKAVLFLAKFHKQHTTHDRSFHLHGDDKSHYKMKMNGVLAKKKRVENKIFWSKTVSVDLGIISRYFEAAERWEF